MFKKSQEELKFGPRKQVPLTTASRIANMVITQLSNSPNILSVISVGSIRRGEPYVKDIDFLIVVKSENELANTLTNIRMPLGSKVRIIHTMTSGIRRRSVVLKYQNSTYWSDFFIATKQELPYALFHHTGNRSYNIRIRAYVKKKGWKLNQYGLFNAISGKRIRNTSTFTSEKDITDFIGITYYQPKNRT